MPKHSPWPAWSSLLYLRGRGCSSFPGLTAVWDLSLGKACLLPSYREGYSEGLLVTLSLEIGEWDESAAKCWRQAARQLQGLCQQHICSLVRGAEAQVTVFLKKACLRRGSGQSKNDPTWPSFLRTKRTRSFNRLFPKP